MNAKIPILLEAKAENSKFHSDGWPGSRLGDAHALARSQYAVNVN